MVRWTSKSRVRSVAADWLVPSRVCGIMRQKKHHGGSDDKALHAPQRADRRCGDRCRHDARLPQRRGRQAAWPNRPVTIICPWGAGGGTDATARIVAAVLEKELKQPFNVVNRTGGSGVVGHSAIATAAPDGYTLGIITVEISMMHWQGLTEFKPDSYTPLALMNEDPPGIQVNASSPYKTVKELADAIKAAPPGKLKASGTGQGGIWHLALVGWLTAMGLKPDHVAWVPLNGAAPAMQDLAAGGLDLVTCSVPEARAIIEAGKARSLAVMAAERNPGFKDVPTLKEAMGIDYTTGAWRGFAAPKGIAGRHRRRADRRR